MTHSPRASPALRALAEADPALAALALWCRHRDVEAGPVAETEGETIRYGPGFASLPLHEQVGLAGHHVLHVALRHGARLAGMVERRGGDFDPLLWSIAADAIVNEVLLAAGHALPRPALTLTGLLADVMGPAAPAGEALAEWDVDRLYLRLRADAGGEGARARAHAARQGFAPDIRPAPGAGTGSPDPAAADWRAHLARALAAGRAAGFGIGTFGHRLADIPEPRTPWEVLLRRLLARAVLPVPAPAPLHPSRGWLAMDDAAARTGRPRPGFLAGMRRGSPVPRIVVALDCSTSIDAPRLAMLVAEVAGIARRARGEIRLLVFDTLVRGEAGLDPASWRATLAAITLPQGGGTDFRPVIARAAALGASVLVVLTDLDGPAGPAPRLPVIWAVPGASTPPVAPFGRSLALGQ